jgi:hypothetical protein
MAVVRIGSRSPLEKSTVVRTGYFWEATDAWRRGVVQHVTTSRCHQDKPDSIGFSGKIPSY